MVAISHTFMVQYERVQVQVASTKASLSFFSRSQIEDENKDVRVWTDDDEWNVSGNFPTGIVSFHPHILHLLAIIDSHGLGWEIRYYTLSFDGGRISY